jgi:HD superfamily phosphohydrolase YqeK
MNMELRFLRLALGHDRHTIAESNFQKLLARAILWLADKLENDGSITKGFEGFTSAYENYSSSITCRSS